jgi:hypothetical protein
MKQAAAREKQKREELVTLELTSSLVEEVVQQNASLVAQDVVR